MLVLRTMLALENKRRDAEQRDETYDDVYIKTKLDDGTMVEKHVDRVRLPFVSTRMHDLVLTLGFFKAFQDLTDIQNRDFRYVL